MARTGAGAASPLSFEITEVTENTEKPEVLEFLERTPEAPAASSMESLTEAAIGFWLLIIGPLERLRRYPP